MKKGIYLFFLFFLVPLVSSELLWYENFTTAYNIANCGGVSNPCWYNSTTGTNTGQSWIYSRYTNNSFHNATNTWWRFNWCDHTTIENISGRENVLTFSSVSSDYNACGLVTHLFNGLIIQPNDTLTYWCNSSNAQGLNMVFANDWYNGVSYSRSYPHIATLPCGNKTFTKFYREFNSSSFNITYAFNFSAIYLEESEPDNFTYDDFAILRDEPYIPNELPKYESHLEQTTINDLWSSVEIDFIANDTENDQVYYQLYCNGDILENELADVITYNFDWDTPEFWDTYLVDYTNVSHWNKTNNLNYTSNIKNYNSTRFLISMDIKENLNKGGMYFNFYNDLDQQIQGVVYWFNSSGLLTTYYVNSSGLLQFYSSEEIETSSGFQTGYTNIKTYIDESTDKLNLMINDDNQSNQSISYLLSDSIDYFSFTAIPNFTNNISELVKGQSSGSFQMKNYQIAYDTPHWTKMEKADTAGHINFHTNEVCYYFENGNYLIDIYIIDENREGRGVNLQLEVDIDSFSLYGEGGEESLQNASRTGNILQVLRQFTGDAWNSYNEALGLSSLANKFTLFIYLVLLVWFSFLTHKINIGLLLSSIVMLVLGYILSYFNVIVISIIGIAFSIAYHYGIGEDEA